MNILFVGNFGTSWDGSKCDEEHIATALKSMGHEVIRVQREEAGQLMVPKEPVDFTLIAQWDGYPHGFPQLLPRPIVYWAFDYQAGGQEWHERLVKASDLYLSKPLSDSKYPNWQWLPQDFSPESLNRNWDSLGVEKEIDVLFTGSYLPWATQRVETLRAVDKMFNLTIHSFTPGEWEREGFKDVRPSVMDEGLKELIPRAKIHLSIDHTITPGYWSDRNAQIMACGGAVLSYYVPMSEMVFRDAIQYFYNTEDCLQQITWLLSQDLSAMEMYAWNFAHQNLMVHNRVNDLLTIVKAHL